MALFKKNKKEEETGPASSSRIADAVRDIFNATVAGQQKAVQADQAVARETNRQVTTAARNLIDATARGQQAATRADQAVAGAQNQRLADAAAGLYSAYQQQQERAARDQMARQSTQMQAPTQRAQDAAAGLYSAYLQQQESLADIQRRQNRSQADTMAGLYANAADSLRGANELYQRQLAGTDTGNRANELMTQPVLERANQRQSSLVSGDPKKGAGKYLKYLSAADFAVNSQAREDNKDATYNYINGLNGERERQQGYAMQRGADSGMEKYQLMTDEERGVYNYLYSTQGKTAANGFLARLDPELNEQYYSGQSRWVTEQATQDAANGTLWTAATVAQQPVRTLNSAAAFVGDVINTVTGKEIDPNGELRRASALTQDIRGAISEALDKKYPKKILGLGAGDLYQNVCSALDSTMNRMVSGFLGEGIAAAQGISDVKAIDELTSRLAGILMSGEVTATTIAEGKKKGYSNMGATSLGVIRGGLEYLFEAIGGETVTSLIRTQPGTILNAIIQVMFSEGIEEVATDIGNEGVSLLADALFDTDESFLRQTYDAFEREGSDNPWRDTWAMAGLQLWKSFSGGALSSFGTAGVTYARQSSTINAITKQLNTDRKGVQNLMRELGTDNPSAVEFMAEAFGTNSVEALREKAAQFENVEAAIDAAMQEHGARDTENTPAVAEAGRYDTGAGRSGGLSVREYAGTQARTADTGALQQAEQMERDGRSSEEIRRETGWFRGMDGKWRFEIDDSRAAYYKFGDAQMMRDPEYREYKQLMDRVLSFTGTLSADETARLKELDGKFKNEKQRLSSLINMGEATLDMILDHPVLYEAYPELRQARIRFEDLGEGKKGAYRRDTNTIALSNELRDEPVSTLLHEIQHAIQGIEGFTSGASPQYWNRGDNYSRAAQKMRDNRQSLLYRISGEDRALYEEYKAVEQELDSLLWDSLERGEGASGRAEDLERRSDELYKALYEKDWFDKLLRYDRLLDNPALGVAEFYANTAGEIEARNAADRRNMTAEERANTAPDLGDRDTVFAEGSLAALSGKIDLEKLNIPWDTDNESTIKEQTMNNLDKVKDMDPVASITYDKNSGKKYSDQLDDILRTRFGYRIDVQGMGEILFDKAAVATIRHYVGTDAEAAAAIASPYVIKRGKIISGHRRHGNGRYPSVTFSAPVILNGQKGIESVSILFADKNRVHALRIMTPDGKVFTLTAPNSKTELEMEGVGTNAPITRPTSSVSENSILLTPRESNTQNAAETERDLKERHPEYANDEESLQLAAGGIEDLQYSLFDNDYISGWAGERGTVQTAGEAGQQIRKLGKGITDEFVRKGYVELRGQRVSSPQELAELCQILRDPRFETFRVILTKGDEIVSVRSVSSRLPSAAVVTDRGKSTAQTMWEIKDRMRRTGADGYYLMHNHPSGVVEASEDDRQTTGVFINELGREGYKGHIILDHTEFGLIEDIPDYDPVSGTTRPTATIHEIPGVSGQDPMRVQDAGGAIGGSIMRAGDVARYGRDLQTSDDVTVIMFRGSHGMITGAQEILNKTFLNNGEISGYLRNQMREYGSSGVALYTTNRDVFEMTPELTRQGYVIDAVYADPGARQDYYESIRGDYGVDPDERYFAGKTLNEYPTYVSESEAGYGGPERSALRENPRSAMGKDGRAYTNNEAIDFTYAIVPLDSLLTSHDRYGNVNAEYPAELQPRDRSRATSQADIDAMAKSLNPDLLADSKTAQNGAPIVTDTGIVISGNGRTAAIQTAYEYGTADKYAEYLHEHAEEFGIDPESIPENPVLVRIAKDSSNAAQLARDLNVTTTAAMSATETAMVDAEKLQELMTRISPDDSDLTSEGNRGFVQAFVDEIVPESERGSMYDDSGSLSKTGLSRIQNAIFATAYGDEERLARLAEYTDDTAKNITKALVKASNGALQLQSDVKNGAAYNVDVTGTIMKALDLYEESRSSGQSFEDFMTQYRMDDTDEVAWDIAQFIAAHKRSSKAISDYFSAMYSAALDRDPNQMSLLGGDENGPTVEEILRDAERYFLEQGEKNELGYEPGGESKARRAYEEDQRRWREDRERTLAERPAGVNEEAERTDNEIAGEMTEESELRKVYEEYKRINAEAKQREAEKKASDTRGVNIEDFFGPTVSEQETKAAEQAAGEGNAALEEFAERMPDDPMDLIAERTPVTTEKRTGEEKITTHKFAGKKTLGGKISDAWHKFIRAMANDGDAVHQAGRKTGNKALDGMFFYAKAATLRAQQWIQGKRMSFNLKDSGACLNEIFDPIRAKGGNYYRDFQLYMYHMLNVERMSRARGMELREAQALVNQLAAANPSIAGMTDDSLREKARQYMEGGGLGYFELEEQGELIYEYWQAKKALKRAENAQNKPVFGWGADAPDADESKLIAQDLLAAHPEFAEESKRVYDYCEALLQYRVDAGLITQEDKDNLEKLYPHYVPVMYDFGDAPEKIRAGGITVSSTVKKAKGGNTTLLPLHYVLAKRTLAVMRNAGYQQLGAEVLNEYENNAEIMSRWVQGVEESEAVWAEDMADNDDVHKPHENVVTVFRNGKRYDMTLSEDMAYAFNSLQGSRQGWSDLGFMVKGNDMFKKLCTAWNPMFMISNPVRDVQDALLYSTDTKRWVKNYPKAIAQISGNGKYWEMYKAMGAVNNSYFDWATGENATKGGKPGKVEALNMAIEQVPRLAEYMTVLENAERNHGEITQKDLMEAFNAAAEITTNFSRGGTVGRWVNRNLVPFWNPGVQGLSKAVRTATETRNFKAWALMAMKGAALGMIPALLNGLLYRDDDEWDIIDDQVKTDYYLFKTSDGIWIKIPKGRMLAALSAPMVGAQEALRGDKVDWGELGSAAFGSIAPNNPLESNLFATAMRAELFNPDSPGKTWYGGDIESKRLQGYAPGERYDESTDLISKWLGGKIGISPKKISYVIDQYSGVLGDIVLPYLTPKAERGWYPQILGGKVAVPLSNAFMSRFTMDTVSSNTIGDEYYGLLDQLGYQAKAGDTAAAQAEKYMNRAGSAVSDYYAQIRKIENDENLTDKEKSALVRELRKQLNLTEQQITADAQAYLEAAQQYIQDHPQFDYTDDAAVDAFTEGYNSIQTAEKYYIDADSAAKKMKDEVYLAINREHFGAEYALQAYSKDTYKKAQALNKQNGLSYEDYFDYYFGSRYIYADKDADGKSISGSKKEKMVEYINGLDITDEQKDALFLANNYKDLKTTPWHGGSGKYTKGSGKRRGGRRGGGGGRKSNSTPKSTRANNIGQLSTGYGSGIDLSELFPSVASTRKSGAENLSTALARIVNRDVDVSDLFKRTSRKKATPKGRTTVDFEL